MAVIDVHGGRAVEKKRGEHDGGMQSDSEILSSELKRTDEQT